MADLVYDRILKLSLIDIILLLSTIDAELLIIPPPTLMTECVVVFIG